MKALTAAEMREAEKQVCARYNVSVGELMERAGTAISDVVLHSLYVACPSLRQSKNARIAILCGKGNNGGDGFVAARHLMDRFTVRVYLFGAKEALSGDAAENCKLFLEKEGKVSEVTDEVAWEKAWSEIVWADAVVDALLGTGLRDAASGLIAQTIESLNRLSNNATSPLPTLIVAVDIPSGLPSDGQAAHGPVVHAHKTVTFIAPKIGQLISPHAASCGELIVRSIGVPSQLVDEVGQGALRWSGPQEFASLPLIRKPDSHKGTFGHALLLAGSTGKSGAAILAGLAALRTGAGLVTIAAPDSVQPTIAAAHPEYMTEPLSATKSGALSLRSLADGTFGELEEGKDVFGIGPGLGKHRQTHEFVRAIVSQTEIPVVLDADGLNAFEGHAQTLRKRKTKFLALTPHPGEMARLLGVKIADVEADRVKTASEAAKAWQAVVILKGFHTVLASSDGSVWVNTMGSASLAKGGSGDILTGILAALTAQFGTRDWIRVLALGVYLHGLASRGTLGFEDESGPIASGIANGIPMARKQLLYEIRDRA